MTFKSYQVKLAIRVILLVLTIASIAYLALAGHYTPIYILVPILIFQISDLFSSQNRVYRELEEFSEAMFYKDFSRHFNVSRSPAELQPLRRSFNEITDTFKRISREKETHYHYLQHVLEIVGTGILSFELETGNIAWMNEAVKKMLHIPQLKTIHALEKRNKELFQELLEIGIGDSKVFTAVVNKQSLKILISATVFQVDNQSFKLLSFQNINEALDETESSAWTRLLGVLNHEIMNSIAPISSLANTLKGRLQTSLDNHEVQPSYREDLELGIETIQKRSEALLKFAETYRNLSRINSLSMDEMYVRDVFESQYNLMRPSLDARNISLEIVLKDPGIRVRADKGLLEQVLINLIVNAMEAVKNTDNPKIILSAALDKRCVLKVTDNGHGVPDELLDKIFIPFFSTKKNGTGIGLNLCKQIMLLHKGSIQVQTVEGAGTSFILTFP